MVDYLPKVVPGDELSTWFSLWGSRPRYKAGTSYPVIWVDTLMDRPAVRDFDEVRAQLSVLWAIRERLTVGIPGTISALFPRLCWKKMAETSPRKAI